VIQSTPSMYGRILKPVIRIGFMLLLGADNLTPKNMRKRLDIFGKLSRNLRGIQRVTVSEGSFNAIWLLTRDAKPDSPVILYLHGGAYVSGSIQSHWELAGRLTRRASARCLIINYRLAPEHPFPAAVDDAVGAWQWLLRAGENPKKMVIAGDSAGGGLALATAIKLRELNLPQPVGIYCMSPFTDLSLSGSSLIKNRRHEVVLTNENTLPKAAAHYAAGQDTTHPLMSPLFGNLSGHPPTLLHVGSEEILLDDSVRFHDRALEAGVDCQLRIWQGMWHVWPLFERFGLREAKDALCDAAEFIRCVTTSPKPSRQNKTDCEI
jgi:epsilon-lactone hydrolase